jgi:hypothetical protein
MGVSFAKTIALGNLHNFMVPNHDMPIQFFIDRRISLRTGIPALLPFISSQRLSPSRP